MSSNLKREGKMWVETGTAAPRTTAVGYLQYIIVFHLLISSNFQRDLSWTQLKIFGYMGQEED